MVLTADELAVDEQRGVLLSVVALRDDEPFHEITTVTIAFDEPIADERFRFVAPAGEEIRSIRDGERSRHVTVVEAQQLAPFTVLIPERIPASWHTHCQYRDPSERPAHAARVALHYRSDDGHESVHITEVAVEDRAGFDELTRGNGWQDVTRDSTMAASPNRARPVRPNAGPPRTRRHVRLSHVRDARRRPTRNPRSPPQTSPQHRQHLARPAFRSADPPHRSAHLRFALRGRVWIVVAGDCSHGMRQATAAVPLLR